MKHAIGTTMTYELRTMYPFLSFFSDLEVQNLLSVVRSVSIGLKVKPELILGEMSKRWEAHSARC